MTDLARLSQLSSRTHTLVLERKRLASLSPHLTASSQQLNQIARNLDQLRAGIEEYESVAGGPDAAEHTKPLRAQWVRMRGMLEGELPLDFEDLPPPPRPTLPPPPPKSPLLTTYSGGDPVDTPYTDDPDGTPASDFDPHDVLGQQHQMMEEQDSRLDVLSHSINRQRDISIHIGNELEVHDNLLTDLDHQLDGTAGRLGSARKRLDRVARGTRENASTVTIALLIFILLILIVIFKT
ncbi:hypothetical protein M407DRAFT_32541 [Tulasnella calospora MUT 4182]|uniref:t-SNARE coiled-coil homology domain-containing protein n=1 Tax=Tulasnella calospora MUT 4182 TaxID=1051891 RepID=A0A0C3Q3Q1_9AGAM|nr:hypothetical protein M407DRAFT_167863 [Tulasnella calospora MUT 4182]KIO17770.1 hypothetical protein M407DRAFT_32541 [Tulasnella calospora MUT 4182]